MLVRCMEVYCITVVEMQSVALNKLDSEQFLFAHMVHRNTVHLAVDEHICHSEILRLISSIVILVANDQMVIK